MISRCQGACDKGTAHRTKRPLRSERARSGLFEEDVKTLPKNGLIWVKTGLSSGAWPTVPDALTVPGRLGYVKASNKEVR